MPAPVERQAIRAVVVLDPNGAARNILELARQHAGVERAALYTVAGGRLDLRTSQGLEQEDLDERVPALWSRARDTLLRGEIAFGEGMLAAPIGQPVSGFLYLAAAGLGDLRIVPLRHLLARLTPFFEEVVSARGEGSAESARQSWLVRTPIADIEREKLALALDQNEWNVSRTARALGVSRRTLYKRMDRHGIERPGGPRLRPQRQALAS